MSRRHSYRHVSLSEVHRLAVARPKLSGLRSSSTFLNQVCLGLPVLHRQSLGGCRMQTWRAREWSWLMWNDKGGQRKTGDRRRILVVSDRSGWPIQDRTTLLETKSVQWIGEYVWDMNYPILQSSSLGHSYCMLKCRVSTVYTLHIVAICNYVLLELTSLFLSNTVYCWVVQLIEFLSVYVCAVFAESGWKGFPSTRWRISGRSIAGHQQSDL